MKTLNLKDVDKWYTRTVGQYLREGYNFYSPASGGTQGEEMSTYLIKDNDIIVIFMEKVYSLYKENHHDYKRIVVGRFKNERNNKNLYKLKEETIWLGKLEILNEARFYMISSNCFVNEKHDTECFELHQKRCKNRKVEQNKFYTDDKHIKIALKKCKKTKGYKSVKKSDIKGIKKSNNMSYQIVFKNDKKNLYF